MFTWYVSGIVKNDDIAGWKVIDVVDVKEMEASVQLGYARESIMIRVVLNSVC